MEYYPIILVSINKKVTFPDPGDYCPFKNIIETKLYNIIKEIYKDKISPFKRVTFDGSVYYPDICYTDKKSNLCIDIEIDEPYSLSGEPTHYIESDNDLNRNNKFLSKDGQSLDFQNTR